MGEEFTYSGAMIVMRDAAQKRLFESSDSGSVTELVLKDEIVFYAGPIITEKRVIIGRCSKRGGGVSFHKNRAYRTDSLSGLRT